jgi:hypothetical protein
MQAVVVYESHWGNTEAIAKAIANGIGSGTRAMTTDQAVPQVVAEADLIVAGAPVMGFRLPTERIVETLANEDQPPTVNSTPMRTWLGRLPRGTGGNAAFETRVWWSPSGATGAIDKGFRAAGYRRISSAQRFVVDGKYGPLREGELDRARAWGAELAATMSERQRAETE